MRSSILVLSSVSTRMARAACWLPLGVFLVFASCSEEQPKRGSKGERPPDVVLILIDTLRPDHLGFYGYEGRETAPFLAKLARHSTVFHRAFSTSTWTAPSTASVFTSLYPNQHGVTEGFFRHDERTTGGGDETVNITLNRLPNEIATLPESFQKAGYTTFGIAANVNIGSAIGFDRGFDHFVKLGTGRKVETLTSPAVSDQLRDWKKELNRGEPNFIYLHFNDVHQPHAGVKPWYEPREDEVEDLRQAYDSEITYLDKLIQQMYQRERWGEAIVMVVSDHGQEFMEHGQIGHKATLYRELLQVLMMVSVPGRRASTDPVDVNVSLIDVAPTLAGLAGLPPEPHWYGESLAPLVLATPAASALTDGLNERVIFAHRAKLVARTPHTLFGAIQKDWQLIHSTKAAAPELYNFIADPLETIDELATQESIASELQRRLLEFQRLEPVGTSERVEVELDNTMLEDLQSLGYVGD